MDTSLTPAVPAADFSPFLSDYLLALDSGLSLLLSSQLAL